RVNELTKLLPNANVLQSSPEIVDEWVKKADVLIGAVLVPGAKAPKVVSAKQIHSMRNGSVVVDVAIDQGGCIETARPTSHSGPTYEVGGVVHYCVTNMPGAFCRTSTYALAEATIPYLMKLADKGLKALKDDAGFMKGLNMYKGKVTNKGVADAFNKEYFAPQNLID
ncbi:alanine dehydrogenase, partial [Candidatus Micrarchaeota archaeon]|nr:alanine dehydrogenase [Candidatus Micrarchaeota archaeon]MBU1939490.1 alanine dehydrogenase [Candidatus Micrarchaeota archaeon]